MPSLRQSVRGRAGGIRNGRHGESPLDNVPPLSPTDDHLCRAIILMPLLFSILFSGKILRGFSHRMLRNKMSGK